jgi:hypothetical protein
MERNEWKEVEHQKAVMRKIDEDSDLHNGNSWAYRASVLGEDFRTTMTILFDGKGCSTAALIRTILMMEGSV